MAMFSLLLWSTFFHSTFFYSSVIVYGSPLTERSSHCQPFHYDFTTAANLGSSFVSATADSKYNINSNGLELYLTHPSELVKSSNGVNDVLGQGATINSTFSLLFGKVTYAVESPMTSGVVTAAILVCDQHDEIDIEILGGDTHHWQSNSYAPGPNETQPLWGVFSGVHTYKSGNVASLHNYTVDWRSDEITWSVDGVRVRTLMKEDTKKNGVLHFPDQHPLRISVGIWDGSNPIGTSQWAKGPINWQRAPVEVKAVLKSVTVEC